MFLTKETGKDQTLPKDNKIKSSCACKAPNHPDEGNRFDGAGAASPIMTRRKAGENPAGSA